MIRTKFQNGVCVALCVYALSACSEGVVLTPSNSEQNPNSFAETSDASSGQPVQSGGAGQTQNQTTTAPDQAQTASPAQLAQTPEPSADSNVSAALQPVPEPVLSSAPEQRPDPVQQPASDPAPEPASNPASEPASIPALEPTSEPTPGPTPEPTQIPAPEPVSNSAPEQAQNPEPDPASSPTPESSPGSAPESEPEPEAEQNSAADPGANQAPDQNPRPVSEDDPTASVEQSLDQGPSTGSDPAPPSTAPVAESIGSIPQNTDNYYQPQPLITWQLQLKGTLNTSYDVELYVVDLFDTSATDIAAIQSSGKRVICSFSAGTYEAGRADAGSFVPADLGSNVAGSAGERWLDIRSRNVRNIMLGRLNSARLKGCDGVDPVNVDGYSQNTGFNLTGNDQLFYSQILSGQAHGRALAIGLRNNTAQAEQLVSFFDFTINESCDRLDECDQLEVFIAADKAVLHVEYQPLLGDNDALLAAYCQKFSSNQFSTLVLPRALDDEFRLSCQ